MKTVEIELEKDSDGTFKPRGIRECYQQIESNPHNKHTNPRKIARRRSMAVQSALNPLEVIGNLAMREIESETKRFIKSLFRF